MVTSILECLDKKGRVKRTYKSVGSVDDASKMARTLLNRKWCREVKITHIYES